MKNTPIIIIGSGRSGTNMLRDIITSIDGFETWDCDEINPIWRYGNREYPTDELPVENATPRVKKFIRSKFEQLQKNTKAEYVVEKTCANSLRLNYVYEIFPDAKYVIINRDGRDVVPSAMKRWVSSFELSYTLKKLRYVPLKDLFYYVSRFGMNRVKKIFSKEASLSFWGPLYQGIDKDVASLTLMEVCANQWKHCAENTLQHRKRISKDQIFDITYESFVARPEEEMKRLLGFFGTSLSEDKIKELVTNVSTKSVGSHKKKFSEEELATLEQITLPTLKKLGYQGE